MAEGMQIPDIVEDRLSVTVAKLETLRPGITLRMIAEAQVALGYEAGAEYTEMEKLHIGLAAALKLGRAALDLYQEELAAEQADEVRVQYQERVQFLREKTKQLQAEFGEIESKLIGDPTVTPPCFTIEKAGDE